MNIILYSTNCPKCKVLEKKLNLKGIKYDTCEDIDLMISKGIMSAPVLEVGENLYSFVKACDWVNDFLN